MAELNSCFFFEGSGPDGFFGILNEEANKDICMSEEAIVAFIRDARPDLFHQLRGLPIRSDALPYDYSTIVNEPGNSLYGQRGANRSGLTTDLRANTDNATLPRNITSLSLAQFHHKHKIQSRLLNGYRFILRRVRNDYHDITCACPRCSDRNLPLGTGQYFLSMITKSRIASGVRDSRRRSYSLVCLEQLFGNYSTPPSVHGTVFEPHYDGSSDMCKRKHDAVADEDGSSSEPRRKNVASERPDFPFNYPSNSEMAISLRHQRYLEIEQVRKADENFQHVQNEFTDDDVEFPSLILRRPPNHTNYRDRYKKQGRTRSWYRPRKQQYRSDGMENAGSASDPLQEDTDGEPSPAGTISGLDIICSCREPSDRGGLDTIECAGDYCMVGLYHLRCMGLEELPAGHADWFCPQCVHYADWQRRQTEAEADDDFINDESDTLVAASPSAMGHSGDELSDSFFREDTIEAAVEEEEISQAINHPEHQLDGNGSGHFTRDSEPVIRRYYRTLLAKEYANRELVNRNRPPLLPNLQANRQTQTTAAPAHSPAFSSRPVASSVAFSTTPFYALAPFITPSYACKDPHALTLDELRRFWGWRAHCSPCATTTELVQATPHAVREFFAHEDGNAMTLLGKWWREEMGQLKCEYHQMMLSDVLRTSQSCL
ncbi:hypothetical protein DV738_g3906, partial [Chaetothyriales sp. CBS 135597]